MKKLTRLKLINWHRFSDVTIDFGDSTLISGENGAGKSTLLDAIQFVVTCSTNHFNKAAHENGKRKLTGYIRCKTGRENHPYERTGEISAHVALEFYEESKEKYFVIGAVIDSATEGQETVVRYLMDNVMLEDEMFKIGNRPRTITEFRSFNNKNIKLFAKTNAEGKKMIKQRFGRIEDKFFQLIPKALAFKPIDDIKDFVYSYVLDEKEVNIDNLRENVRSYQELEKTLEGVKNRIEKLSEIECHHKAVVDCIQSDRMYEYFMAQSDLDLTKEQIGVLQDEIRRESYRLEQLNAKCSSMKKELENKEEVRTLLLAELNASSDFQTLEKQKKYLKELQEKEEIQYQEKKRLLESGKKAGQKVKRLLEIPDVDECMKQYDELLHRLKDTEDVVSAQELIDRAIAYKKHMSTKLQRKNLEIQSRLNEITADLQETEQRISNLKQHRFSYPPAVELLMSRVEQELLKIGRTAKPRILCEMLEIKDETWRNAVEGYLNTQRFYVLVEPEHFDIALGIYEKLRREKKAYGVGLINSGKLEEYDIAPAGSLATVVESKSIYAKRYVNMVLGKVHMCKRVDELKQYPVSITPNCMRYQNHVASAIRPEIYTTPFIGKNAFKVQYEQALQKKEDLNRQKIECKDRMTHMEVTLQWLEWDDDTDVKYRITIVSELKRTGLEIEKCETEIRNLQQNTTMIEKQIRADEMRKECEELKSHISKSDRESGACELKISSAKDRLVECEDECIHKNELITDIAQKAENEIVLWKKEYEKQTGDKTLEQFRQNFDRRRKANNTTKENADKKMTSAMYDYKTAFDFGAAATLEAYPEYAAVQERLVNSELLNYEEKVRKAKLSAEEEFREQFLSKLQENMKQAQGEFKELNKALKDITFSNERYEFLYLPSKSYGKYYDMIMDDFNVVQGESIFSGLFHENHKEVIDELFSKLALDQDNGIKALDEFTDYRTYMDYDIKITHEDGSYSLYSKVCEEKSGGETQTPFYVTVAASFVQLYNNNIGGEAIGLVMFDEAFNNMDDERIGAVLEFMNRLPLQIVIAAPPDKIQYIGPKMQETLLVLTDDKVSFVEEYRYASGRK